MSRICISYGTTTISGGTITSTVQKSNQSDARGVCVNGGTTTIQNGANITANAPTKAYGVYCSGANGDTNRGWPHVGVVNITGGTITANTTNTTIAYGLYVTGATWTINRTNSYKVFCTSGINVDVPYGRTCKFRFVNSQRIIG